jgi:hypothetical protein
MPPPQQWFAQGASVQVPAAAGHVAARPPHCAQAATALPQAAAGGGGGGVGLGVHIHLRDVCVGQQQQAQTCVGKQLPARLHCSHSP